MATQLTQERNLTEDQMKVALRQLDQALYHHDQWLEDLYCTLICRVSPDERDVAPDAHHLCRFGHWYYGPGSHEFQHNPSFDAVEDEHRRVHELAADLLRATSEGRSISVSAYENLANALKRMRLEMLTLKHEFEEVLLNLDPLTGVANRVGMLTKLREQQEFVKRKVGSCGIAMMDLDHFKLINDTYGHAVGDQVLRSVAQFAKSHIRPYDKMFRYGGEEFLFSMPNTDLNLARALFERLRDGLANVSHHGGNGHKDFKITVSLGLALLDPDVPIEQSIDRADKALYQAKSCGRNCVCVWDASMM